MTTLFTKGPWGSQEKRTEGEKRTREPRNGEKERR
jgi:hypothetical protein